MLEILWLHIARSSADEDHHHAVASLHRTGNDLQEDSTTRGSGPEPLNRI